MHRKLIWVIVILVLTASGLAGGLVVHASFTGDTAPEPEQAALPTPPDLKAGGNPVISYQGVLKEGDNPYVGPIDMDFVIYQGGTPGGGGTMVWQESQQNIEISGTGYFSTLIGGDSSINQGLFSATSDPMYLEVIVGTQTMNPRQRLAGVPYAFHAYYSGTAVYAHSSAYADNAGRLDGLLPSEYMLKDVYDTTQTDNVVDEAELAWDSLKLGGNDAGAFMLEDDYDTNGDGSVNEADLAGSAANWTPILTAGGNITAGETVGVDSSGKLVAGCGNFGITEVFSEDEVAQIDLDKFSSSEIAIAYFNKQTSSGEVMYCATSNQDTWEFNTPTVFLNTTVSQIDVSCFIISGEKYVLVSYIYSSKGYVWIGHVENDGSITEIQAPFWYSTIYYAPTYSTLSRLGGVDSTPYFVIAFGTYSEPKAIVGEIVPSAGTKVIFGTIKKNPTTTGFTNPNSVALSSNKFLVVGKRVEAGGLNGTTYYGTVTTAPQKAGTVTYFDITNSFCGSQIGGSIDLITYGSEQVLVAFIHTNQSLYGAFNYATRSGYNFPFLSLINIPFFRMSPLSELAIDINPSEDTAVVAFVDMNDEHKGKLAWLDITGSDIDPEGRIVFSDSPVEEIDTMWLDDNFFVVAFSDIYNGSKGKLVIGKRESIDPVGIAKESGVANDPIQVAVGGSVDWLTGLVAGKTYYGTISGQLTTVNTGCKIGRAISATELVLNIDY